MEETYLNSLSPLMNFHSILLNFVVLIAGLSNASMAFLTFAPGKYPTGFNMFSNFGCSMMIAFSSNLMIS